MSNISHGERVVSDSCQCHGDRQLIEKEKKIGFWVLVTSDRRRKEQNGKKGKRKKKKS